MCYSNIYEKDAYLLLISGKTLVHEFAHLRWGLLDEFPGEGQYTPCDEIYGDDPKTCAKNLKVKNITRVPCILLPDLQSVGNASLMYMAYHPKVSFIRL